jgi:DNA-binding NarL/FixJ family response regulator
MSGPIRLLLIDDHTLFRESLVRFLAGESTLAVAGHCATVAEGRAILAATPVDLILLDYDLGGEAGTELLPFLRESRQPARVLMLTAGMSPATTRNALQLGVAGIVLKQTGTRDLLEAIERVASGKAWWGASLLSSPVSVNPVAAVHRDTTVAASPRELTERQRLVLRGILDGLTNKEIGARLDVSETSIKASVQELFNKAGVRTRGQLVRIALERFSSTWLKEPR